MSKLRDDRPWLKQYDPGVPSQLNYPAISAFEILEQAAQRYPDSTGIISHEITLTYAQMNDLSDRFAAALIALKVNKGDRVGLLMPNIPQFVISYFAAMKSGAVVVAINPMYRPHEIHDLLNSAGVVVLVAVQSLKADIPQAVMGTQVREVVWVGEEMGGSEHLGFRSRQMSSGESGEEKGYVSRIWSELVEDFSVEDRPKMAINPEDEALFQFSGGTTGVSKAVIALHRNLVANALQFRHWLVGAREGEETMMLAIPLYHVYGMVVGMLVAVQLGARMVLISNPRDLKNLLLNLQKYRVTLFPGVPNLYRAIVNDWDVQSGRYDLSSIIACISGSAPLLRETKERFEHLTGGKLLEGYGLSEAPTATHCNPMYGENRTGSIGLPLPDVDCRIVDLEDGVTCLPPSETGELIIRGPQVMKGYFQMPEETSLALRDGWLYTGDIARMDTDGYFYLVDRKKDVIKPGGFQVWPREVEEALSRHPIVLEAGVAGVLDPVRGEAIKAWVVLRPEYRPGDGMLTDEMGEAFKELEDELRRFCREELAPFKVPSFFEFLTELPKSNVGKVLRRELVRRESR